MRFDMNLEVAAFPIFGICKTSKRIDS